MSVVHVVFSEHDLLDGVQSGIMDNRPEDRKRLIMALLRSDPCSFSFSPVPMPDPGLALALNTHSIGLISFLERAWDEWMLLWADTCHDHRYLEPFSVSSTNRAFVPAYVAPRVDGHQSRCCTMICTSPLTLLCRGRKDDPGSTCILRTGSGDTNHGIHQTKSFLGYGGSSCCR
jgi:hypothetical protein